MTINEVSYNWAYTLTKRSTTDAIIIHHAAASGVDAQTIHSWHLSNGWSGIAYHYYVRKDGSIYRGRPEEMQGGHTSGENYHTIGICFEGNFETDIMPDAQFTAGQWLVADILTRYVGIAVTAHRDWNATACPGANFPLEEMKEMPSEEIIEEVIDTEPSDYAKESCQKALDRGIINGDENGDCMWKSSITRQDFCVLMDRLEVL